MAHYGGNLMDIYVCGGNHVEKLCELCKSLSVAKNIKQKDLLNYGFTNCSDPYFFKSWGIQESDNYSVSFSVTIRKKSMKIEAFDLLDNNFCQPHPCGKEEFNQIEAIIKKMINYGIFCKKVEEK